MTSGIRDTTPRWSPDGRRIAFVRSTEKDGKAQPAQIYLLQMDGGEARAITEIGTGAGNPVWSPDGTRIAFGSSTSAADAKKADDQKPAGEHKSDVEVVTRAVYRENGNPGDVDNEHHAHIFSVAVPASEIGGSASPAASPVSLSTQVTDGEFSEGGMQWSPDGSTIYFMLTRSAAAVLQRAG